MVLDQDSQCGSKELTGTGGAMAIEDGHASFEGKVLVEGCEAKTGEGHGHVALKLAACVFNIKGWSRLVMHLFQQEILFNRELSIYKNKTTIVTAWQQS